MKKFTFITMLAAVLGVGCTTDDAAPEPNNGEGVWQVTATLSGPQTRASIGEEADGKMPINWTEGDELVIYNMRQVFTYKLEGAGGTSTGLFTLQGSRKPYEGLNTRFIYPKSAMSASTGRLNPVPTAQTYTAGSFDPAACAMQSQEGYNLGDKTPLVFTAEYPILCLQLIGDKEVSSVKVELASGGTYTLDCPTPVALDPIVPTPFYIVVPAGQTKQTVFITTTDEKVKEQATADAKTLIAGNVHRFPVVSLLSLPIPEVTHSGNYTLQAGQPVSKLTLAGTASYNGQTVPGALTWKNPDSGSDLPGEYRAGWVFTPDDLLAYETVKGTVSVTYTSAATKHVYVSGQGAAGAMLWKDGVEVPLTVASTSSIAYAVGTSLGKTYAVGRDGDAAICWIDGTPVALPTTGMVSMEYLQDVSLYALNGSYHIAATNYDYNPYMTYYSLYWGNGELNIFEKGNGSYTKSCGVYVTADSVYVCGGTGVPGVGGPSGLAAILWRKAITDKTWTMTFLPGGMEASAICVADGHVYSAGRKAKTQDDGTISDIVVWKDGVELYTLASEADNARPHSICVDGEDIYVYGTTSVGQTSIYNLWKNQELNDTFDSIKLGGNTKACIEDHVIYVVASTLVPVPGTQYSEWKALLLTRPVSGGTWTQTMLPNGMHACGIAVR